MNVILASTSSLFGGAYLDYLKSEIIELFKGKKQILFIPFARPSGISHDEYAEKAKQFFSSLDIEVNSIHHAADPNSAIMEAEAYFVGGGNTFLLVKMLHELDLMNVLAENVNGGKPYLGTSAGSNIGGINMKTTNDMPIVYPPDFKCMGLVPFNINPHYLDPDPHLKHNGETRETRILEFLTQNNTTVVGLREGNWIRIKNRLITTEGTQQTRIFEPGKSLYELNAGSQLKFDNASL